MHRLLALLILLASPAGAHEAITGWTYPDACCDEEHCRVAWDGEVVFTARGWYITTTHETIAIEDARVSPDHLLHICIEYPYDGSNVPRRRVVWPKDQPPCVYVPHAHN